MSNFEISHLKRSSMWSPQVVFLNSLIINSEKSEALEKHIDRSMKFNWRKLKNIVCWKELTRTAGHALCAGWYRALKCVDWLPKVRFSCAASLFLVNFHLSTVPPAKPAHFHVAHNIALPSKLNVSSFEFKLWIARFAKWRSWNSIVKNDFTFGSADFLKKTIETYQMKFIFCQILLA